MDLDSILYVILSYTNIKDLVNINHALLVAIGVSHPALDHIKVIANNNNIAAKILGAGGGGCMMAFIPSSILFY